MIKSRSRSGRCRLCGQIKKLSKEHIPPQSMGNNKKVYVHRGYNKLGKKNMRQYQNGYYSYTLCKQCNSFFGANYVPEGKHVYEQMIKIDSTIVETDSLLHIRLSFCPLKLYKYCLTLFLSFDSFTNIQRDNQLREFLSHPESVNIPDNTYIGMFYCRSNNARMACSQSTMSILTNKNNPQDRFVAARMGEVSFHPIGFVISDEMLLKWTNPNDIQFVRLYDLLGGYGNGQRVEYDISLPVLGVEYEVPLKYS